MKSKKKEPRLDYEPLPNMPNDRLASITDEEVEDHAAKIRSAMQTNKEVALNRNELLKKLKRIAGLLYGVGSKERRYISKLPSFYANTYYCDTDFLRAVEDARKKREKEEEGRKALEETAALTGRAIEWLMERGEKINEDFTVENAVRVANEIAYDEEVKKMVSEREEGEFFSFDGDGCCVDCSGWDGTSHRCECGNRRVYWAQGRGHTFEDPYVYAEAN